MEERQHTKPDLPNEVTVEEDVVRRLKLLSAKGESRVAIDATLLDEIDQSSSSAAEMQTKGRTFSRTLRVPKKISTGKGVLDI